MITKILKRDGSEVNFDKSKIFNAIAKSNKEVDLLYLMNEEEISEVVNNIVVQLESLYYIPTVEDVQEMVETQLMQFGYFEVAKHYIRYRYEHKLIRENDKILKDKVMKLVEYDNENIKQENSNKNPEIIPTQRDYMAGEISKDITMKDLLPSYIVEAHERGLIHFHDSDYFIQHSHNCCLVNLEDMLQNGTVISGTLIEKPHTFSTACNIATQIIAQVASCQYGGQSISLAHLAPFVESSRNYFKIKYPEADNKLIDKMVINDIKKGVQIIQYQVITLMTTNGQAPFVTLYMDINEPKDRQTKDDLALIIEEVLKQRIEGVKNEKGAWITPAFPKLIYALDDNNVKSDTKYYYLTELAAKCTAKRMVPDYISNKIMRKLKGDTYTCMGCRSFLTPDRTTENWSKCNNYYIGHKYYGRFNQGVVTVNLPYVALMTIKSSGQNEDEFFKNLDSVLDDICYPALMARHNRLKGTSTNVAPILWQHGALARLGKDDTIDELLYHGYSTISLGYAGLYECTMAMTSKSHTDLSGGKQFAIKVMDVLNQHCREWKASTDIDFSLYGTPIESTTYKFAKALQREFGIYRNVSDKNYITNSYHVHVTEPINAFDKLTFESDFQSLSPGGAISYVEVPNMMDNIPAVLAVIEHIYNNIMYAELNTKSDYCQVCEYEGEVKIEPDTDSGKLIWKCPNCGNTNQNKLNVARRTCGYIGTNFWNQGRTQEISERVLHL